MIKLLIFDFYKTLGIDVYKADRKDFFAVYQKLGIDLSTPEKLQEFNKVFGKVVGFSRNWLECCQQLLKELRISGLDKAKALADFYQKNLSYQLYDDAKEIINLPYKKAILTAQAKFLLQHLNLDKFATLFTPQETKFLKPDPRAFLMPLQKFKVKPEEALMIGDEVERDLVPAKNLGMETILIDRENKIGNPPFRKITSLKELKEILNFKF